MQKFGKQKFELTRFGEGFYTALQLFIYFGMACTVRFQFFVYFVSEVFYPPNFGVLRIFFQPDLSHNLSYPMRIMTIHCTTADFFRGARQV